MLSRMQTNASSFFFYLQLNISQVTVIAWPTCVRRCTTFPRFKRLGVSVSGFYVLVVNLEKSNFSRKRGNHTPMD